MARTGRFFYWFLSFTVVVLAYRWVPFGIKFGIPAVVYHLDERAVALYSHMLFSSVPMALVPFQLSTKFRKARPRAHRIMGRLSLAGIILGGLTLVPLALNIDIAPWGQAGFIAGAIVWITSALLGFYYIRRRNFQSHQFWMTISAVTIFGAVTQRLVFSFVVIFLDFETAYSISAWSGTMLNLPVYFLWRYRYRISAMWPSASSKNSTDDAPT